MRITTNDLTYLEETRDALIEATCDCEDSCDCNQSELVVLSIGYYEVSVTDKDEDWPQVQKD